MAGTASLALGVAYSVGPNLKRSALAAGFSVATAAALTYVAGALTCHASAGMVAVFTVWAAWIGVVSVVKDLSDVAGDRLEGRRTLPVLLGPVRAAWATVVAAACCAAGFVVTVWLLAPSALLVAWVVSGGSALLVATLAAVRPGQDRHTLRRPYRTFMVTQFGVNLVFLLYLP